MSEYKATLAAIDNTVAGNRYFERKGRTMPYTSANDSSLLVARM